MRIIVDAMGGDNAPGEIVAGAVMAAQSREDIQIFLIGKEEVVSEELKKHTYKKEQIEVVNATEVIETEEPPVNAIRTKKDSSIVVGMNMVRRGEADAFCSAGSSGAILVGGQVIVGRIKGVERPPLAPLIPTEKGVSLLIDCGANADCTPEYLLQFAYLGNFYAQRLMGMEKPRVGLLNIGAEPSKGDTLRHETYALLEEAGREGRLNFIGNIEANTALLGGADVIVADGYSGNILLKTVEGAAKLLLGEMKKAFLSSTKSKLGALLVKDSLGDVKKLLDPSEVGGTPFLGISKPVLKAHGSSDARAIRNAVFRAVEYAQSGIIADVEAHIDVMKVEKNG